MASTFVPLVHAMGIGRLFQRRHREPWLDFDWMARGFGLGFAFQRRSYTRFKYELIAVIGPFTWTIRFWRTRR